MPCKPCAEKKNKPAVTPMPSRWLVVCTCGLSRTLPEGIKEGDEFQLVPCPRCGSGYNGKFLGSKVEKFD